MPDKLVAQSIYRDAASVFGSQCASIRNEIAQSQPSSGTPADNILQLAGILRADFQEYPQDAAGNRPLALLLITGLVGCILERLGLSFALLLHDFSVAFSTFVGIFCTFLPPVVMLTGTASDQEFLARKTQKCG